MTAEIDRAIRKTNLGLNPVSDGKTLKIQTFRILPSLTGLSPRSTFRMARSISAVMAGSHGAMTMREGSGTVMLATWLTGTGVP